MGKDARLKGQVTPVAAQRIPAIQQVPPVGGTEYQLVLAVAFAHRVQRTQQLVFVRIECAAKITTLVDNRTTQATMQLQLLHQAEQHLEDLHQARAPARAPSAQPAYPAGHPEQASGPERQAHDFWHAKYPVSPTHSHLF